VINGGFDSNTLQGFSENRKWGVVLEIGLLNRAGQLGGLTMPRNLLERKAIGEAKEGAMKPANWIPRDGLLARAVRRFREEGHSLSRIARELRLNRRTVSRLYTNENPELPQKGSPRAQK